jgi:hypothetical protein
MKSLPEKLAAAKTSRENVKQIFNILAGGRKAMEMTEDLLVQNIQLL